MRVLAIDDDSLILKAIRRLFGKETKISDSLDEALLLASEHQPTVILLDASVRTAGDGLDAIPSLLRSAPASAVIVLTGRSTTDDRRRAHASGARAYIDKMHIARLPEIVDDILKSDGRRGPDVRGLLH